MISPASIAQFMSMLSGGGRSAGPTLAGIIGQQNMNRGQSSVTGFDSLVSGEQSEQLNAIQTRMLGSIDQQIVPASRLAGNLDVQLPSGMMASDVLKREIETMMQAQQASADMKPKAMEEFVTLALKAKGLTDAQIDQVLKLYNVQDLFVIVKNPVLEGRLDDQLQAAGIVPTPLESKEEIAAQSVIDTGEGQDDVVADVDVALETKNDVDLADLVAVFDQVMADKKDVIGSTISFKVDEEQQINDLIRVLIDKQIDSGAAQNPVEAAVRLVDNVPLPANFVMVLKSYVQSIERQSAMPVNFNASLTKGEKSLNPFADMIAGDRPTAGQGQMQNIDEMVRTVMDRANPAPTESIADRMAAIMKNTDVVSVASMDNSFSSQLSFAGGDASLFADMDGIANLDQTLRPLQNNSHSLIAQTQAAQPHPASQSVAMTMIKAAFKGVDGEQGQRYRLQLDPPEMGRVDIQLEIMEGNHQVKAVISSEKPETLGMLQRDMHTLLKAMQDAGFENMSADDFSFENFQDMAGGESGDKGQDEGDQPLVNQDLVEIEVLETEMSIFTDPVTGQKHVNMVV
jgi:flagellar hook-length control protein FliK